MSDAPSPKRLKEEEEAPPVKEEIVVKNYGDHELSDVCLVVGTTEFNVHKMILANRSKYFKALFFGNFKEKDQDRIDIVGADPLAFERMLDVIYDLKFKDTSSFTCGEKTNNTSKVFWENAGALWAVLDRFDVDHGKEEFGKAMFANWCAPYDNMRRCSFCVNRVVFYYINNFDLNPPKISFRAIKEWAEKHFVGAPEMANDVMQKLLLTM